MVIIDVLYNFKAFDHVNIDKWHISYLVRTLAVFLEKLPINRRPATFKNNLPYWADEVIAFSEADKFFKDEKFPSIR